MFDYYDLTAIPVILKRFKVNNIIICGDLDKRTMDNIFNYIENNDSSYNYISSNKIIECEGALNILQNLNNYDAIFINDDSNWYTIYNELEIIKKNNNEFPLVFICNNIFPHKYRDSYINPNYIPNEFINDYSDELKINNVLISDGLFHAITEGTPKNGVSTAIDDFLIQNINISLMDFKLSNGITILYYNNGINHIRLSNLSEEINCYYFEQNDFLDNKIENQLLTDHIIHVNSNLDDVEDISSIKNELYENKKIIQSYEDKINLHDEELNYKNSQIDTIHSKLDLKDSQIKNMESKLLNRENEINNLNNTLDSVRAQVQELKNEISNNESNFNKERLEYDNRLLNRENEMNNLNNTLDSVRAQVQELKNEILNNESNFNKERVEYEDKINCSYSQINSLADNLSRIEQKNSGLNSQLQNINYKINQEIDSYRSELSDVERELNELKCRYINQLSKLDNKKYCISCYKEEITNNNCEIDYLKNYTFVKQIFKPLTYVYLIVKSNPKELSLNFKLYKALKNSNCFDIGYYLNNNEDLQHSNWCKYFSPELHYVCRGFAEKRKFNKKFFNRNSKKELLDYINNCSS